MTFAINRLPTILYNEIDPKAAAWLRELCRRNLIAPGEVDERSIADLKPADLRGVVQFHTFAGIGVWSYSLRLAGWPDDRPVWTGSAPCQPWSAAGKGGGFDDERHLSPIWCYLIRECRPDVLFGEQVSSKDALAWFDTLQHSLEDAGYACGVLDTCSAGVGAPHIRQRLRFVAQRLDDTASARHVGPLGDAERLARDETRMCVSGAGREVERLADAEREQRQRGQPSGTGAQPGEVERTERLRDVGWVEYSDNEQQQSTRNDTGAGDCCGPSQTLGLEHDTSDGWIQGDSLLGGLRSGDEAEGNPRRSTELRALELERVDNNNNTGLEGQRVGHRAESGRIAAAGPVAEASEFGGLADAGCERRQQIARSSSSDENAYGRARWVGGEQDGNYIAASHGQDGRPGPTSGFWRAADWLHCRDGKWRPVEPGTFPLAHGAPARVGRLRGYGNAVDAIATKEFIEAYLDVERDR